MANRDRVRLACIQTPARAQSGLMSCQVKSGARPWPGRMALRDDAGGSRSAKVEAGGGARWEARRAQTACGLCLKSLGTLAAAGGVVGGRRL